MNGIFQILLLSLLVLEYISRGKYFVLSAWNQSCIDNKCSCCVEKQCGLSVGFPDGCPKGCIDGHRGARCYEMCTYDCKSCLSYVDICEKCYDGFYLGHNKVCTSKCPPNCKTCSSNSRCDTCKEGFYDKDGSTTCKYSTCPTNCECDATNCVACKNGFYDKDNSCNKTCPPNCLACSSLEHCSKCQNGFYNGIGPNGDISPRLSDCTYKCRETCTLCSSYENCQKCAAGKYGLQCQATCSVGCKNNICSTETGRCNCTSSFLGEKCSECVPGKYGYMCEHNCPRNCKNNICDRLSGHPILWCDTDIMSGAKCDKCNPGRYGTCCENICPENCKNRKCNKDDGNCSEGCEDYFVGTLCVECINGKYGDKCQNNCPDTCVDHMCKKQSGDCYECTSKFEGNKCDTIRKPQAVSADSSTVAVFAVLAALFVVACAVIGFLILMKIVKKIRSADRQPTESLAQVHIASSLVEEHSTHSEGQTVVSDEENITYDVLDTPEAPEHAYDLPKP